MMDSGDDSPRPLDREFRIYCCSDALDTVAEREYLQDRVLPEARRLCWRKGLELTWIDHQASTTAEAPDQAARIRDIEWCRPFFVCLLGDRLNGPGLESEFREATGRPGSTEGWVYRRQPNHGPSRPDEGRIEAVLKSARAAGMRVRDGYDSAEVLGEWLLRDLEAFLLQRRPADVPLAPVEVHRTRQRSYRLARSGKTLVPEHVARLLDEAVQGPGPPVLLVGASVPDASSLLAEWRTSRSRDHESQGLVVVERWGGAIEDRGDPRTFLARLTAELQETSPGFRQLAPWVAPDLGFPFPRPLDGDTRVLLLMDGLERFGDRLDWFPRLLPSMWRLIGACAETDGPTVSALRGSGARIVSLTDDLGLAPAPPEPSRDWLAGLDPESALRLLQPLAASRWGLSETEWMAVADCPRAEFVRGFLAISSRLIRDGGLWYIADLALRTWLEHDSPGTSEARREIHRQLARVFQAHPIAERRDDELPWHLRAAEEWRGLADALADLTATLARDDEIHRSEWIQYWRDLGNRSDPASLYLDAIARAAVLGIEPDDLPRAMCEVAQLLQGLGRLDAAEDLYRSSLARWETAPVVDPELVAQTVNNLASVLAARGWSSEAEPLFRRALDLTESTKGPNHPFVEPILHSLAQVARDQARPEEAVILLERLVAARQDRLGLDHPVVGSDLHELGTLLFECGDLETAESRLREALVNREAVLGRDHPETAASLHALAATLETLQRPEEAEFLYQRARAIRELTLGADHLRTAETLNELALLLHNQERWDEAEPLQRRALAVRESALGPDHPETATSLNNLAELLRNKGDLDAAEPLYRRALAIDEAQHGPDHPDTGISLNNLALLACARGDFDGAEPLLRRALAIAESRLGSDHPQTVTGMGNLAELLLATNRFEEAEPLLRQSLEVRQRVLGPDHPLTIQARRSLEGLLGSVGTQPDEAMVAAPAPVEETPEPGPAEAGIPQEPSDEESELVTAEVGLAGETAEVLPVEATPPVHDEDMFKTRWEADELTPAEATSPDQAEPVGPHPPPEEALDLNATKEVDFTLPPEETVEVPADATVFPTPTEAPAVNEADPAISPLSPEPSTGVESTGSVPSVSTGLDETQLLSMPAPEEVLPAVGPAASTFEIALARLAGAFPGIPFEQSQLREARRLHREARDAEGRGLYREAVELCRGLVSLREQCFGPGHPRVAQAWSDLARAARSFGDWTVCVDAARRAVAIAQTTLEPHDRRRVSVQMQLARALAAIGKLPEIESILHRVSEGVRSSATGLDLQASLARARGDIRTAEDLARQAVELTDSRPGTDTACPNLAFLLNNWAGARWVRGSIEDALALYQRALTIVEDTPGPEHPATAIVRRNLASVLHARGALSEAEPLYRQAVDVLAASLDSEHPHTAQTRAQLARIFVSSAQADEAEVQLRQALDVWDAILEPDDPRRSEDLLALAAVRFVQGKLAQAQELGLQALAIRERAYGPDHPRTALALEALGRIHERKGDTLEAIASYRRALPARERAIGADHPEVVDLRHHVIALLFAQGDREALGPLLTQALASSRVLFGPNHSHTATCLRNLGGWLVASQRISEAIPRFEEALAIDEVQLGKDHPDILKMRQTIEALRQAVESSTPPSAERKSGRSWGRKS